MYFIFKETKQFQSSLFKYTTWIKSSLCLSYWRSGSVTAVLFVTEPPTMLLVPIRRDMQLWWLSHTAHCFEGVRLMFMNRALRRFYSEKARIMARVCAKWQWNARDCYWIARPANWIARPAKPGVQSSNTSWMRFTVTSHTPGRSRFYYIHIASKRNWDGHFVSASSSVQAMARCRIGADPPTEPTLIHH